MSRRIIQEVFTCIDCKRPFVSKTFKYELAQRGIHMRLGSASNGLCSACRERRQDMDEQRRAQVIEQETARHRRRFEDSPHPATVEGFNAYLGARRARIARAQRILGGTS